MELQLVVVKHVVTFDERAVLDIELNSDGSEITHVGGLLASGWATTRATQPLPRGKDPARVKNIHFYGFSVLLWSGMVPLGPDRNDLQTAVSSGPTLDAEPSPIGNSRREYWKI